jgi:hypothetical protein
MRTCCSASSKLGGPRRYPYRRDRLSWQQRLDGLATERDQELEAVAAR